MIRDTFETNPGLCELFKRKMLERAKFVGLSDAQIDFESQIDLKGTYHDNLRTFYREYPQLSQDSDYFRIKSGRALSGAALEESWRSYEENNSHETLEQAACAMPELVVTYTVNRELNATRQDSPKDPELVSKSISQATVNPASTHGELAKLILDRVTVMAGEKVTRKILHQIGQEIGRDAFQGSGDRILPHNLLEALDHAVNIRGWGRVTGLHTTDHGSSVTYTCTIEGCPVCQKRISTTSTCDISRGIVSRWLESFVQKSVENVETSCTSAGSHLCVHRVTFKR